MTYGEYRVVGNRAYRDHQPGDTFIARLDPRAAQRAIDRGDIQHIRTVEMTLQPGSWTLPERWAGPPPGDPHMTDQPEARKGLFH